MVLVAVRDVGTARRERLRQGAERVLPEPVVLVQHHDEGRGPERKALRGRSWHVGRRGMGPVDRICPRVGQEEVCADDRLGIFGSADEAELPLHTSLGGKAAGGVVDELGVRTGEDDDDGDEGSPDLRAVIRGRRCLAGRRFEPRPVCGVIGSGIRTERREGSGREQCALRGRRRHAPGIVLVPLALLLRRCAHVVGRLAAERWVGRAASGPGSTGRSGVSAARTAHAAPLELPTRRLVLRTLVDTDYDAWIEVRRRCREWLIHWEPRPRGAPPISEDRANFASRCVIRERERQLGTGFGFGIFIDGHFCGEVTLSSIQRGPFQSAFVGYWVDEARAGQGIVPEAVVAVLRYAFESLHLHRVEISIIPRNRASRRVVEKLGIRLEGIAERFLEIDGEWEDHCRYAMTSEEWQVRGPELVGAWIAS
jgi:[ribosomal protein S5]-alanine N-acetyltransferase